MAKNINSAPNPSQINLIASGTTLEGTLTAKDDIRISGKLKGTLRVEGKVIIAQEGIVEGDVFATDADVAGTLIGEINVKSLLVLKGSAKVQGTVRTTRLIVEEGAVIDGSCEMGQLDKSRAEVLKSGNITSVPKPAALLETKPKGTFSMMSGE